MKKLGILLIVAVLALGAMGAGYAFWTQALTVDATVDTGWLSAGIHNNIEWTDNSGGRVTVTTGRSDDGIKDAAGSQPLNVLDITIDNAYPGYAGTVTFYVENTGTVPFYVSAGTPVTSGPDGDESHIFAVVPHVDDALFAERGSYSGPYTIDISCPGEPGMTDPAQKTEYTISIPLTALKVYRKVVPRGMGQ
jgi:hypothetical protein